MKKVKVIACILSAAMLAGIFAGCSKTTKITTDKFAKACERLKLTEVDLYDGSPDEDDFEDGFYAIMTEDDFEDDPYMVDGYLSSVGLDDIIDSDDVQSMGVAFKFIGMDELDGIEDAEDLEDLADMKIDGAFAMQISLADNYVGDVMDFVDDMLDTYYVNTKDLTNKEYFVSKNDGYLRMHIDLAKFLKIVQENDDIMDAISEVYDEDDFTDLCKQLSGDVAVTVEINGSNIFILGGVSLNTKASVLGSFASAFGASNPTKLPMNNKLIEGVVEDVWDDFGDMAGSAGGSYYDDFDYDDFDYDLDTDDWDI